MSRKTKRRIRLGIILALIAAALAAIAFAVFHDADVLTVKDGKLKGISSAWLIGYLKGEERYVKLADVGFIQEYKTRYKDAEDPDGDPLTNFYAYQHRKPESNPGVIRVHAAEGGAEEAAKQAGGSAAEKAEIGGKSGYRYSVRDENGLTEGFIMDSPYPGLSIAVLVTVPEEAGAERAETLLSGMIDQVTPGKKLSALASDFKQNFIDDNRWTFLTNGLLVTVEITLFAVLLGIVIGVVVAIVRCTWDQTNGDMRDGAGKIALGAANDICRIYLTIIRGTPVVVQLMIIYYVIFTGARDGTLIGALAFGINSGAYVAEIIRGGIMSVDRGQLEAGRSLGFNYVQTMRHIIIPQAFKSVLPALANEFIVLLKETSVAGYVAVMDLTKGGETIRGQTHSPFMPLLAVAIIYLIVVMFFTWLVGKLERRLRASDH